MPTFLFDKIVFGPVKSRRLGVSLGINLLPTASKVCSFDCIYCECGWTPKHQKIKDKLPARKEVADKLEKKLIEMSQADERPDVITFAGNGEPTLHPEFSGIIDNTIALRNRFAPEARIAVLSNASMLHKIDVFEALMKIEDNIQKLDSGFEDTIRTIDCPSSVFNLEKTIERLIAFHGKVTIQTLFLKGEYKNKAIDNTTEKEINQWISILKKISPQLVMIYTIARDTPTEGLEKVSLQQLNQIAEKVKKAGFDVQVSS